LTTTITVNTPLEGKKLFKTVCLKYNYPFSIQFNTIKKSGNSCGLPETASDSSGKKVKLIEVTNVRQKSALHIDAS